MEVVINQHEQQCGVTAADIVADAVVSGATTLGLATGSSPLSVYRELIRRHRQTGLSFAAVQAFLLDEYVGLTPSHPQSYAHVIRAEFTDHVDIDSGRVHSPNGVADDIFIAATEYDALIADVGPSMFNYWASAATDTSGSTSRGRHWGHPPASRPSPSRPDATTPGSSPAPTRYPATSSPRGSEPSATPGISYSSRQAVTRRRPSQQPSKARLPQAAPPRSSNSISTSRSSSTRRQPPT
jgi:hypothetical protein